MTPDETRPKLFLVTLKYVVEHIVSEERADLRTHKNPLLIFAWLSRGNFSARYLNADPVRSMAFTKFFIRPSLMCRGGSRILCILPVLGVAHSSIRPSEISSEASLSSGNAKSLLGCPIHIKKKQRHFVYPSWRHINRDTTFRSPQTCQPYLLYSSLFSSCFRFS